MGIRQACDSEHYCWNVSGIFKFIQEDKLVDLETDGILDTLR